NLYEAGKSMRDRVHFGCMMIDQGEADVLISGLTRRYPDTLRPAIQIIGMQEGVKKLAGMYLMLTKKGPLFFADTTVNFNPSVNELVDITLMTAKEVELFNIKPKVAMLSYSNFGSSESDEAIVVREAVKIIQEEHPELIIDGEIQGAI